MVFLNFSFYLLYCGAASRTLQWYYTTFPHREQIPAKSRKAKTPQRYHQEQRKQQNSFPTLPHIKKK
jgi:hypothetical protein